MGSDTAVEKLKTAKCTACAVSGHDILLMEPHEELSAAWRANACLPPPKEGRFLVCEGCADWARETSNEVMEDGMQGLCLWCLGRSAGRAGSEVGHSLSSQAPLSTA